MEKNSSSSSLTDIVKVGATVRVWSHHVRRSCSPVQFSKLARKQTLPVVALKPSSQ